jgi:hypothetical protein
VGGSTGSPKVNLNRLDPAPPAILRVSTEVAGPAEQQSSFHQ